MFLGEILWQTDSKKKIRDFFADSLMAFSYDEIYRLKFASKRKEKIMGLSFCQGSFVTETFQVQKLEQVHIQLYFLTLFDRRSPQTLQFSSTPTNLTNNDL